MKFSELVKLLEQNGISIIKEKGSVRYYGKEGLNKLVRWIIMVPGKSPPVHAMLS
jgi:predicted RNA binding protein YcfA (HicA-like mRNA interferase family)